MFYIFKKGERLLQLLCVEPFFATPKKQLFTKGKCYKAMVNQSTKEESVFPFSLIIQNDLKEKQTVLSFDNDNFDNIFTRHFRVVEDSNNCHSATLEQTSVLSDLMDGLQENAPESYVNKILRKASRLFLSIPKLSET